MKKLMILMMISLSTIVQAQSEQALLEGTIKINVDGLACPYCAYGLEKNLKEIEGVKTVEINVEDAYVILGISEGKKILETSLREKIKIAGFTAGKIEKQGDE